MDKIENLNFTCVNRENQMKGTLLLMEVLKSHHSGLKIEGSIFFHLHDFNDGCHLSPPYNIKINSLLFFQCLISICHHDKIKPQHIEPI